MFSPRSAPQTIVLLIVVLIVVLASCSSPSSVTPTVPTLTISPPRPTDTPTSPPPVATPTPLAMPVVLLPDGVIATAEGIARAQKWELSGVWAPEHTTLYAQPGAGLLYMLSAYHIPSGLRTVEQAISGGLDNIVLGVLFVANAAANPSRPPGVYTLALSEKGQYLNFADGDGKLEKTAAVLRHIKNSSLLADRPFTLISSQQMCLSWDALQVCVPLRTPLPSQDQERLVAAAKELGADPAWFDVTRGIFDIEGVNNLERCASAVKQRNFEACQPSILVAPISQAGRSAPIPPEFDKLRSGKAPLAAMALAPPLQGGEAGLIGIAVVFTNTIEEVYRDPLLKQPAPNLPADAYLMYDILLPGDPQIGDFDGQPITLSRVELRITPAIKYYLPDVRNIPLLGDPVTGGAPPVAEESEAAAVHLLLNVFGRRICVFKARECPSLRNTR